MTTPVMVERLCKCSNGRHSFVVTPVQLPWLLLIAATIMETISDMNAKTAALVPLGRISQLAVTTAPIASYVCLLAMTPFCTIFLLYRASSLMTALLCRHVWPWFVLS